MGWHRLIEGSAICLLIVSVEESDALHAAKELAQQVALVGAVNGVTLQTESHQQRVKAQNFLELCQDGYASASAAGNGLDAIDLGYCA